MPIEFAAATGLVLGIEWAPLGIAAGAVLEVLRLRNSVGWRHEVLPTIVLETEI